MDDPLRPKTVPLSAETILWFEFLLDPSLLTVHLSKENQDPSPIELINQFLSVTPENQCNQIDLISPDLEAPMNNNEALKIGKKQLALKILGLKVASHLKWNLETIEKKLTLQKQVQLLSDLCTVTSGKYVSLPLSLVHECNIGSEGSKWAFNFALTLYHRWVLRAQLLKELPARSIKPGFGHILTTQEQANSFRDEMFVASLEPFTQTSIDFLTQICKDDEQFGLLTYDSFVSLHPSTDRATQNFDVFLPISKAEVKAQVCFDLCTFYLHIKKYDLAKENVIECKNNLEEIKKVYKTKNGGGEFLFCTFDEEILQGCLLACGVAESQMSLFHRMNHSVLQRYKDITEIFKADNITKEISLVNRRIVELDIEGSCRTLNLPKDLLVKVAALNVIRSILEENSLFSFSDYLQKYTHQNGLNVLVEYAADIQSSLSLEKRNKLKSYFLEILLTSEDLKHLDTDITRKANLFTADEILNIRKQRNGEDIAVPPIATMSDWKTCDSKISRLEVGALRRQLISCSTATGVRKLLVKLAGTNPNKPLWSINPSWILPMPLQSVIMSLQRGFLQDFSYIIVGKAKEMTCKKDFTSAISMLAVIKSETQRAELQNIPAVVKLGRLIDWEILLVQMIHTLDDWPKSRYDSQIMVNKCKQCLLTLQNGDNTIPRMEILDHCASMLLNLNEWNALVMFDKRFPSLELCSAFANAVLESENFKAKKVCRDAWDYVLPMFSSSNKRSSASRDSPTLVVSTNLLPFLKRLRSVTVITIVLSLLAKLHNILKDDSNMEIVTDCLGLWPTSISNATAYSIRTVSETLSNLLKQALYYYPQHIPWIRLRGELEYVNENNEAAMANYVSVLITGTEYCALHLQRPLLDDHIVKRMIKCSLNLGCNMQAAVLCQFLEEADYVLAFKSISEKNNFKTIGEKSTSFCDAMDAYYNCIWDPTLLEFIIHQHSKKGEHKRKQQAISIMGQLELNANNNEEIKREAAAIRRTRFLRALAKQYML